MKFIAVFFIHFNTYCASSDFPR